LESVGLVKLFEKTTTMWMAKMVWKWINAYSAQYCFWW